MLNLIIAVIGERFGIILEQTIPMDCVERSNLMLEIEGFASFFRSLFDKCGKVTGDQFIHFVRYRSDMEDDEDADVDVEGRMRVM